MGLARDLTMGTGGRRGRPKTSPDVAALRRMTKAAQPDLGAFRDTLDRVATRPGRLTYAEGMAYQAAAVRYTELSGKQYGPQVAQH
jgi:hypothetical protein